MEAYQEIVSIGVPGIAARAVVLVSVDSIRVDNGVVVKRRK